MFYDQCKTKHAIEFFKWRKKLLRDVGQVKQSLLEHMSRMSENQEKEIFSYQEDEMRDLEMDENKKKRPDEAFSRKQLSGKDVFRNTAKSGVIGGPSGPATARGGGVQS